MTLAIIATLSDGLGRFRNRFAHWRKRSAQQYRGFRARELRRTRGTAFPSKWKAKVISGLIFVGILFLGISGVYDYAAMHGNDIGILDAAYLAVSLFVMESGAQPPPIPWDLELARWLAPVYTTLAALGLVFNRRWRKYWFMHEMQGHVVIFGLTRQAVKLARGYRREGRVVVLVANDDRMTNELEDLGILLVVGSPTHANVLEQSRPQWADTVICLQDSLTNLEIAARIQQMTKDDLRMQAATCFVHLDDLIACRNLRDSEITRQRKEFRLEYFNFVEMGAKLLVRWKRCALENILLKQYQRRLADPTGPDSRGRVLIFGFGRMGETLLREAVRIWRDLGQHYLGSSTEKDKLRVTVVGENAPALIRSLLVRSPYLASECEITAEDPAADLARFDICGFAFDAQGNTDVAIAYVVPKDHEIGLTVALRLHRRSREHSRDFPIVFRAEIGNSLDELLPEGHRAEYSNLLVYDIHNEVCRPDRIIGANEWVARSIHHQQIINAAKDPASATASVCETRGNLVPWDQLGPEQKEMYRLQVDRMTEVLDLPGSSSFRIVRLRHWDSAALSFQPGESEQLARRDYQYQTTSSFQSDSPNDQAPAPWSSLLEERKQEIRDRIASWPQILARVDLAIQREVRHDAHSGSSTSTIAIAPKNKDKDKEKDKENDKEPEHPADKPAATASKPPVSPS